MNTKSIIIACGLALAALSAFANDDHDAATKFKRLDTDGDGRISRAEFAAAKQEKFNKLDANNDGVVSADEKAAASTGKKHWWSSDKAADKSTMDTNQDHQLSATEEAAAADRTFNRLDTNSDGYLSESEFAAGYPMKK